MCWRRRVWTLTCQRLLDHFFHHLEMNGITREMCCAGTALYVASISSELFSTCNSKLHMCLPKTSLSYAIIMCLYTVYNTTWYCSFLSFLQLRHNIGVIQQESLSIQCILEFSLWKICIVTYRDFKKILSSSFALKYKCLKNQQKKNLEYCQNRRLSPSLCLMGYTVGHKIAVRITLSSMMSVIRYCRTVLR